MQVLSQSFEHSPKDACPNPILKTAVTGLVRRIPLRQVAPWGARTQHPQDAVKHTTARFPRAAAAIFAARWLRNQWVKNRPLRIGQVTGILTLHLDPLRREGKQKYGGGDLLERPWFIAPRC